MREPSVVSLITRKLEEDIVLGRRHPRERLVEQDLCENFKRNAATSGWRCSNWKKRVSSSASRIAVKSCAT